MQARRAKDHPLRQIAHSLLAFCPNGLIYFFRYAIVGRLKIVRYHRHEPGWSVNRGRFPLGHFPRPDVFPLPF